MAYKEKTAIPVVEGGTGSSTIGSNGVLVGNGTSAITSITGGTTGQFLGANTGSAPTWQTPTGGAINQVFTQIFTSSGTYTPTSGMVYCIVECIGGGGGSAGSGATTTGQYSIAGGGGGGGYARKLLSAATVGASQTVTVGAGGTGGTTSPGAGGTGGSSSLGSLCVATGGTGSAAPSGTGTSIINAGGTGGAGTTGDVLATGGPGGFGAQMASSLYSWSGRGGDSIYGAGGLGQGALSATSVAGNAGLSYGGGGGGGIVIGTSGSAQTGSAGAGGIVIVTEFV